jgi:hypothetical protein
MCRSSVDSVADHVCDNYPRYRPGFESHQRMSQKRQYSLVVSDVLRSPCELPII